MAIQSIKVMGDSCLYQVAQPVVADEIKSLFIQQVITDLIDTLREAGGVGIAAPQIGVPLRIIVINIEESRARKEQCDPIFFEAHINPEIIHSEGMADRMEACLSLPGLAGLVPRSTNVTCVSSNRHGEINTYHLTHFAARVFQHEIDHLNGQLYWSRVKELSKFGFIEHFLSAEDLKAKKHLIDKQRAALLHIKSNVVA